MSFLTRDFVQEVSPDLPWFRKSRITVILGNVNPDIVHEMAVHAAKLYISGKTKKIIVTGGKQYQTRIHSEAQHARQILLSRGAPGSAILFENKSYNSFENIVNARRLMLSHESRLRRENVQFLGYSIAARRFLMTIRKNWPEITPSFVGFDDFKTPKFAWHGNPAIMSILKDDFNKWSEYIGKEHIEPVDIRMLKAKIHKANKAFKIS